MTTCPNCQSPIPDGAQFCPRCGAANPSFGPGAPRDGYAGAPHAGAYGHGGTAAAQSIPDYLVQSILVTLCCCIPLGIVAIIFSVQTRSKKEAGDVSGAMESSRKAKMWCWIAFGLGIVMNIVWLVFGVLGQILAVLGEAGAAG